MHFSCRVFSLLLAISFSFGSTASAQESGEYGPFSPEEAQKRVQLHPDCKIELVAAEPDVIDPVHIAFNTDGKLWVVEYSDYPNGPNPDEPGLSRIRVLTDDDGDGRYTNPTTFADKLLFANGLMFWKDGVIVTTDGKIQFMRDTDGDGKSDETQVWFQGFATENPQLRHNHPQLAMDCKIYIANGLRGGNIVPGKDNPWGLDPNAKPLSISGRDFRFDPLSGKYEAIAGQGQFGMAFDQYGNRFVCTNRNPCRQIVLEDEQLTKTPGLRISRHYEDVAAAGEESRLYPISRTWTTSNLHANQFTAACGVLIYQDGALLGREFLQNAFTCDPTANVVHRSALARSGPTFNSKPGRERVEFLSTKDEWFRPVNLSHGPDSALYIVDMYRAVIEHPQFMPDELKNRPDLTKGTDRGRIWKVVPKQTKLSVPDFEQMDAKDLDQLIENLQGTGIGVGGTWQRSHAFRRLFESQESSIVEKIRRLNEPLPYLGFELLNGLQALKVSDIESELLNYAVVGSSASKILMSASNFDDNTEISKVIDNYISKKVESFERLISIQNGTTIDVPDDVRDQVTWELNAHLEDVYACVNITPWSKFSERNRGAIVKLMFAGVIDGNDPYWMSTYLSMSARNQSLMVLEDLLKAVTEFPTTPQLLPVIHDSAQLVARQNHEGSIEAALDLILTDHQIGNGTQMAVVAGLIDGYSGGNSTFRMNFATKSHPHHERIRELLSVALADFNSAETKSDVQPFVIDLLGFSEDTESLTALMNATSSGESVFVSSALSALLKRPAEQVNSALADLLPNRSGSMRRSIIQALATTPDRADMLLDELEAGRVALPEIDATVERLLRRHKQPELAARVAKLLKREPPADRVKVLAEYQACLSMDSDPLRGRIVFEKNCATCHKIGDVGVNVAPDISDSRTKQPDYYLTSIIDPNRAIDANYFSHTLLDTNGKVYTGVIAAETSASVTLKQPEGKTVTIAREEIEEFKNNGVSLMPVALERTINKQQMADLISFIKNWRYLDGQVPKEVIR